MQTVKLTYLNRFSVISVVKTGENYIYVCVHHTKGIMNPGFVWTFSTFYTVIKRPQNDWSRVEIVYADNKNDIEKKDRGLGCKCEYILLIYKPIKLRQE